MAVVLAATGFFIYVRVGSDAALVGRPEPARRRRSRRRTPGRARHGVARPRRADGGPSVGSSSRRRAGLAVDAAGAAPRSSPGPTLRAGARAGGRVCATDAIAGRERRVADPRRSGPASGRSAGRVVVASSLEPREETLDRLLRELAARRHRSRCSLATAGRLRPRRRRAAAGRGDAPPRGLDRRVDAGRPPPDAAEPRRDLAPRRDAERHARAARSRRSSTSGASSTTRATSSGHRSRCCARELELALRHPRSREELEQALRSAADEAERLSRLAEDLLLFARFDQGRLPIRAGAARRARPARPPSPGGIERRAGEAAGRCDVRAPTGLLVERRPGAARAGARQPGRERLLVRRRRGRALRPRA